MVVDIVVMMMMMMTMMSECTEHWTTHGTAYSNKLLRLEVAPFAVVIRMQTH